MESIYKQCETAFALEKYGLNVKKFNVAAEIDIVGER